MLAMRVSQLHCPGPEAGDVSIVFAAASRQGEVLSTLKLECGAPSRPILRACRDALLPPFRRILQVPVGEISRLALAPHCRAPGEPLCELLLGMFRKLYEESRRRGLEYLVAGMRPGFQRQLQRVGLPFVPVVGGAVDHPGTRVPCAAHLDALHGGYREIIAYQRRAARTGQSDYRFLVLRTGPGGTTPGALLRAFAPAASGTAPWLP